MTGSKEGLPFFVGGAARAEGQVLPARSDRSIARLSCVSPASLLPLASLARPRRALAFTLIELVTVIGIMALMVVIAIPAFESATKGSAVGTGAGQLVNILTLARAQAVTTRSRVRVVFADGAYTNATALSKQAYAVLQWTNQDLDVAANWVYVDRWQALPKGAYFSGFSGLSTYTVPFPSNLSTGVSMTGVEFNNAGAVATGGDLTITIQEGMVVNGTPVANRAANTNAVVVYSATGRAKVIR